MNDAMPEKMSALAPGVAIPELRPELGPLIVKLLYVEPQILNKESLAAKLIKLDPMMQTSESDLCLFYNDQYQIKETAGNASAPILVSHLECLQHDEQSIALQQTWDWPESKSIMPFCNYGLIVADIVGAALPARERLTYFQTVLTGVLESNPPQIVFWPTSQRLTEPATTMKSLKKSGQSSILTGAVNVRSYRDQQNLSHHILDTLGLEYFGLIDFQCHFHSMEIASVAAILYELAAHVYEHGNVIEDGSTVSPLGTEQWTCSLEWSSVAPRRPVLNLRTGTEAD